MHNDDVFALGLLAVVVILVVALLAGNITNQLLAPVPSIAGPLGAAVALIVFVSLVGKSVALVIHLSH